MNRRFLLSLAAALMLPLSAAAHNGVDHNPHHGGVLKTYGNNHFEAVLVPGGLQVFFSEASGASLPASAVSQMEIEIERPGAKTEYVAMTIDPTGVFWFGKCQPITDPKSVARIGFVLRGKPGMVEATGTALLAAGKMAGGAHRDGH
jgi:hypothetical protein